jgi:hypothetical protein
MEKTILILLLLTLPAVFAGTQTVSTVIVTPSTIDLNAGSTKYVTCTSIIIDTETWESITTINATIWDTVASAESSADDNNNHYTNTSCNLGNNDTLNSRPVTCGFSLQYYSNSSTWTCKIRTYNSTLDLASNETNTTVNSLVSLDVPETSVNFGALNLGNTSPNDANITITNTGNIKIDVDISGTDFSCSSGSLGYNYTRYSDTPESEYTAMTELTNEASSLNLNVPKSTGTDSIKPIFWKISLPSSGIGGICTNIITFTAKSG